MTAGELRGRKKRSSLVRAAECSVYLVICVGVIGFYTWTAWWHVSELGPDIASEGHYNLLVDGFRSGHLYLKREPAKELALLANPYDPDQNRPYKLHDASYYRGKFYLYFGVTPALVLFLPYVALTGHYVGQSMACVIFSAIGYLVSVGIFLAVRRRYFPRVGIGCTALGVALLGLGTLVPLMLRRPDVWEVPISCAYAFVMVALAGIYRSIHAKSPTLWLVVSGLAYGLAIGSRPSVLFGAGALLIPIALIWARERRTGMLLKALMAVSLPLAVVAIGMMAYNYSRFGDVLEFGQKYQLASDNQNAAQHFSVKYLWFNFRVYFLEPTKLSGYFPFVHGISIPPAPPGQFGIESPYGVMANVPFVLLAAVLPALAWFRRHDRIQTSLGWFLAAVALVFLGSATVICLFGGATNRYQVEFLPALILLSAIAALAVYAWTSSWSPWRSWLPRIVVVAAAIWSIFINLGASFQFRDLLRVRNPAAYRALAIAANSPRWWWDRALGHLPGPVEMKIKLPPFRAPANEPLLVTGVPVLGDYLFIHYAGPNTIVLGFEHTGYGGPKSDPIEIDYAKEHTLSIEMGSFYPPLDHPYFAHVSKASAYVKKSALRVALDGNVVLEGLPGSFDASSGWWSFGRSHITPTFGDKFTGEIRSIRHLPASPQEPVPSLVGSARISIRFPQWAPEGTAEPVIATGVPGAGDVLLVQYLGSNRVVFGLDCWGAGLKIGQPVVIDPKKFYTLEIEMGSLYGVAAALNPQAVERRRLMIRLDGQEVLAGEMPFHPSAPDQIFLGINGIGGSSCGPHFSGVLRWATTAEK